MYICSVKVDILRFYIKVRVKVLQLGLKVDVKRNNPKVTPSQASTS
jgi:hypothetical protein